METLEKPWRGRPMILLREQPRVPGTRVRGLGEGGGGGGGRHPIFFWGGGFLLPPSQGHHTVDPPLASTVRGLCYPPATRSDHWYGGVGVLLGDSEAWKPQKVGGCGWNRCPHNMVLSHVAQDTARSWFWPCGTQITHI